MTGWTELFGCSSCGRNFSTQDALTEHLDSPKHPYKCARCKSHYADIDAFRLHLDLTHSGYMCTFAGCSFWSATEPDVDEHSREHAQDQKDAGLKARKLGYRNKPDAPSKSASRTESARDPGEHPSSVPPSSDQPRARNRTKAGAPASSSSTPRSSFDPRRMPCPFRRAIYKQCPSSIKDKYAACRSSHNNISSLIEHLSQPVHGLEVTERTISSFNVAPTVPPVRKAGMCKRCWKVFSAAAELETHLTYPCKQPSLTTCDKHGILYHAFAKAGEIEESKETGSMSNEAQISADRTQQMPSVPSASRLPPLEENFLRDFMCCDRAWPTMHDLLQHYEEDHTQLKETQPMDSTPIQPTPVWKAGSPIGAAPDHAVSATKPPILSHHFGHRQHRRPNRYSSRGVDSTGAETSLVSLQELMSAQPAVTEEALDASDNFVLFPWGDVDGLDPLCLDVTSSTTSHTQMAGSPSNGFFEQVLQDTDNQVLGSERFSELPFSGYLPSFRYGSPLGPGPFDGLTSIFLPPQTASSSAQQADVTINPSEDHSVRGQPTRDGLLDEGYKNIGVSDKIQVNRMEGDRCPSCSRSFPAGGGQCPYCEVITLPAPDAREEKSRTSAADNVSPESTVKLPPFRLPEYAARTVDEMSRVRVGEDNVGRDDHQNAASMGMTTPTLYSDGGPPPPLPPPRLVPVSPVLSYRLEAEHDERDPVNLKHRVPPPPAEVGSDPIAIPWWKRFKSVTDTARATQEDDPVGVEDSQSPGRGNQQDINGGVDRADGTASRPPLSNLESDTWKLRAVTKEPDYVVTEHPDVSLRASHGAGSNFGRPESGVLPEQSDSGYASALRELPEGSIFGHPEPDGDVSHRNAYVATAQTDSGYASHTHEREPRLRGDDLDRKESPQLADTSASAEDDETDVGTIYSDDRSQASVSRTQCYIAEFVDHLFGKIRHMMEDCSIGRLVECLPELLQAFALKVGQSASTRGHFEVMYFVHKHRRAIALSLQDRIRQNESHGLAEVEDRETDPAGMSLDDKLSLWAEKASGAEPEHEFDDEELPDLEPFEDELDINELYRYQSLIVDSPAFDWLVGSMRREIQLNNSAVVGMMLIRRRMLQDLPSPRHVSRRQAVPCVQVTFTAPWDPVSFVEEQGYDPDTEDILGKVITLTGSSTDVQAATCEQYLCQTWPSTGKHILRILGDTFQKKAVATASSVERRTYTLPDNTRITASCVNQTLTVEASGTAYSMVEIGEQLGWLTAALRSSPDESTMAVFYPTIARFQRGSDPSQPFSCSISASFVGYEETPGRRVPRNGGCWHRMFKNPVVVRGYPIPRRHELEAGTGLEIPLDMLVALTDATGLSEFDGKTFIKGYSAMLIPTEQVEDLILWHLLFNEDGTRISYTDCRLAALDHIQTTDVKQARHILGWVSHARNNTGSPYANYHIKWTGLGKPRERHAWEKVIISGGDPVGVSASFVIGKKDKGIFAGALGGYTSRLKFIAKQYVVLYDLADRRAWLVDGLSALLHLVRASLEHDQRDVFNSFSLYKRGQIKECSPDLHGLDAAAAVLFNPENYSLKLYTESEDTWDEETERQHNGAHGSETVKEVVSKRKVTYYCLRDKVLEIFSLLEKMVDHLNNVSSETGVGFRLRGTPRNILEGFDFMDVATSGAPLRPHMIKLNICESGRGWTDLLRSIQAITLFGKGFGELIAPATRSDTDPPCGGCGYGISLPTGKDYLATCVSLVERVLMTRGSTETVPWCLADDIYWHTPGALFDPCQCISDNKCAKPSDRVQVLLPSTFPKLWGRSFASPSNLESEGAVIFSHNWRVPFRLGHQNSQDQKMLELPDSGLGTSIDSSSGRSQISGSSDDSETQASDALDGPSVHSAASPTGTQPVLETVDIVLRPDNGTLNRKRKLVDIVDRVKRKVLKTSQNIELDQFTDGRANQSAASSLDGTAPFIG